MRNSMGSRIHKVAPILKELCEIQWDQGNEFFPPTSLQITNINAGTGADNVIPGDLELIFNFRYSTQVTHIQLQERIEELLANFKHTLTWRHSGPPFLTQPDILVTATQQAIRTVCGYETILSTGGGTSDGRFIAPTGAQVIEIGPINATIHKIDECVNIEELEKLSIIYQKILENLLLT